MVLQHKQCADDQNREANSEVFRGTIDEVLMLLIALLASKNH